MKIDTTTYYGTNVQKTTKTMLPSTIQGRYAHVAVGLLADSQELIEAELVSAK